MNTYDKANVGAILSGRGDNFTAQLFRLIAKADADNAAKLAKGFPDETDCVLAYLGRPLITTPTERRAEG